MKSIFSSLFLLTTLVASAQKLTLNRIELVHEKIVVYYTLEDANPNHEYQVSLYSSKDNFATPLVRVTGDVGTEIKPGKDKKIEWNAYQELGSYRGDISVEVRARVYVPFVKITSFDPKRSYKRGKTHPLLWTSGNMGGQVDIELFNGQDRVYGERNIPNTGKYDLFIPASTKPGKDYRLKFTNTRNRDEFIFSNPFRVVPKISFALKAGGALLLVGGTAAIISGLGGGGGKDPGTTETPLEGPPEKPN
jgi:hypothetical protein